MAQLTPEDEELGRLLDEKVAHYTDPEVVRQKRVQAEKIAGPLSTEQWKGIRSRSKNDLFFLSQGLLNYDRLSVHLHGHLCRWLGKTADEQFRMVLLPRGHFKSTIGTIGDSIQIALPDVDSNSIYPRNLGTNVRILIGHETEKGAERKLVSILGHFLSNSKMLAFWPECIPQFRKARINKSELELPRTQIWDEPTFDTVGVGGAKQGAHYNFLKLDDLIGAVTRASPAEMEAAIQWFDNVQSYFSLFAKDKWDIYGTRWAKNDLYGHAIKVYDKLLRMYVRAVWEIDEETGEKEPIFPEEFPLERLKVLQQNWSIFSAQYLNDPQEGINFFNEGWLKYYQWGTNNRLIVFSGDSETVTRTSDCDILILIDPAMTGKTGFVVTAVDKRNRIFLLDAQKKHWRPEELTDYLFRSVQRWWPRAVIVESVIFSGLYKPYWESEMRARGVRFNVIPVPVHKKEKEARVLGLSSYFSSGQIYVNVNQKEFIEEYKDFGTSDDYHTLDALAQGPAQWRQGRTQEDREHVKKAEDEILRNRDVNTGYSLI